MTESTSPPPKKTRIAQNKIQDTQEKTDLDESLQEEMDIDKVWLKKDDFL